MVEAYKEYWVRFLDFKGKTKRRTFWLAVLAGIIVSFVLSFVTGYLGKIGTVIYGLFSLACFLPGIAMNIRRMHDIKKSGWWVLIALVPIVGWVWYIVLVASKSK